MTQKFGRNFRLTIYPLDNGDPIIITLPFTINFVCSRSINAKVNTLSIEILNLSEVNRQRIYQDKNVPGQYFSDQTNPDGFPTASFNILLEIGYGTVNPQLYRAFYGRMFEASSAREGTNIVTRIEALGGLFDIIGTQVQTTLAAGSTVNDVLLYLIGQFPNLQLGAMGDFPLTFPKAVVLNGNSWELLRQYSNGNACIDNGKIYVMDSNHALNSFFIIDDSTGILQTPRRDSGIGLLSITTLMEPAVNDLQSQVQIQSTILPQFNGTYKVLGIRHYGTISSAVGGKAQSNFLLQAPGLYDGFGLITPGAAGRSEMNV